MRRVDKIEHGVTLNWEMLFSIRYLRNVIELVESIPWIQISSKTEFVWEIYDRFNFRWKYVAILRKVNGQLLNRNMWRNACNDVPLSMSRHDSELVTTWRVTSHQNVRDSYVSRSDSIDLYNVRHTWSRREMNQISEICYKRVQYMLRSEYVRSSRHDTYEVRMWHASGYKYERSCVIWESLAHRIGDAARDSFERDCYGEVISLYV